MSKIKSQTENFILVTVRRLHTSHGNFTEAEGLRIVVRFISDPLALKSFTTKCKLFATSCSLVQSALYYQCNEPL